MAEHGNVSFARAWASQEVLFFYFILEKEVSDCYTCRKLKTVVRELRADWRMLVGGTCMIVGEDMIGAVIKTQEKRVKNVSTEKF